MHAGGQYIYHTIRSLTERGHRVHVLCYTRDETKEQIASLAETCQSLTLVTPAYTLQQKNARFWYDGWRRPWTLGRRAHLETRAHIRNICQKLTVDVIHLAWTETGRYLDAISPGVGAVLGTMDVEYLVRPREVNLYPAGLARWRALYLAGQVIRGERHYVQRAGVTLACSEADHMHLANLGDAGRIHVVHPWIDSVSVHNIDRDKIMPGRLSFMGAMDRFANVAAARFLLKRVWPVVQAEYTTATLYIIGVNPPESLRREAENTPRVQVTGFAPDMAAEWASTDVAVSPSLIGGGLVTKVAQPMAAGRPVVTTTLGNEGVAAPAGIAVEVADDATAFAGAVLRLLRDREHWTRMAAAGRHHVLAKLNWETSLENLETAYVDAIRRAREVTQG